MRVVLLFLDGVGIGTKDETRNPFFAARLPTLLSLVGGKIPDNTCQHYNGEHSTLVPLDPNLGVEGLPQSGTGQTALFTGFNGAQFVGKHFGPFPYSTLRPIIAERNIFRQLLDAGKRVSFANAFPKRFFDYLQKNPSRLTVTTLSCVLTGVPLRGARELAEGKGISADITNEGWPELGHPHIHAVDARVAGKRLADMAAEHDFVLFEFWKTDKAGHAKDMKGAIHVLETFDAFLGGIVDVLDTAETLLLITSDHGNLEDLSTKAHTRNMVPAILYGLHHGDVARELGGDSSRAASLIGVTPAIVDKLAR